MSGSGHDPALAAAVLGLSWRTGRPTYRHAPALATRVHLSGSRRRSLQSKPIGARDPSSVASPDELAEKTLGLFLNCQNVAANLFERPQRLRLVEVASGNDLQAALGLALVDPGVRQVGQDFAADECFDAALLQ